MLQEGCWATAQFFSKCESQYCKLYCDTGLDRHGLGDRTRRVAGAQGHALSATIRPAGPRYRPRHGQGRPRHGRQRARMRPGWWIVSRYTVLYHDIGKGLAVGGLCHDTVFVS